jgi:hypothetical protein
MAAVMTWSPIDRGNHRWDEPILAPDRRCPFCTRPIASRRKATVEHVIPESWYPDNMPSSAPRPQVIGCKPCNQEFDKREAKLLRVFGLTAAVENPFAIGITQRVLRGLSEREGRGLRDAYYRAASFTKIKREFVHDTAGEGRAHWMPGAPAPHQVLKNGIWRPGNVGLPFSVADVDRITEKFGRGLYLYEFRENLPWSARVEGGLIGQEGGWEWAANFISTTKFIQRVVGPGVRYFFSEAEDVKYGSIWFVLLWERLLFYIGTVPDGFTPPV